MKNLISIFCFFALILHVGNASAQQMEDLERRVQALEQYVQTIPPTLTEFSTTLESGINNYTQGLEANLQNFSQRLTAEVERRMAGSGKEKAVLDPYSNTFQRIESNVGTFLIAVQEIKQIKNGYRLKLNIGNPTYADFRNFTLKLLWADRSAVEVGKATLSGMEYSFEGVLKKGSWNSVEVDLVPASGQLYIESELYITGAELEQVTP